MSGGNFVEVTTLVGRRQRHSFLSTHTDDAKKIINADVIVLNGLGLEGWMERLIAATKTRARVVVATR